MTDQDKFSELISAFLDGEVTPEEQARVEDRLVENADDRRLFEKMRTIRTNLRSLPRRSLEKDLSERILRRAERAMLSASPPLSGDAPPDAAGAEDDRTRGEQPIVATSPTLPDPGSWRSLIWAGLAVAAAVLVMVWGRPWFEQQAEVAKNIAPADSPVATEAPAHEGVGAADEMPTANAPSAPPGKARTQVAESRLAKADVYRAGQGERKGDSGEELIPPQVAQRQEELSEARSPALEALNGTVSGDDGEELKRLEIPSDGLMVVQLDLAPAAIRDRRFYESLSRNEIEFDARAELFGGLQEKLAQRDKAFQETDGTGKDLADGQSAAPDQLSAADRREFEFVYVEAPVEQVEGLFDDLAQHADAIRLADAGSGPPAQQLRRLASQTGVAGDLPENLRPSMRASGVDAAALPKMDHVDREERPVAGPAQPEPSGEKLKFPNAADAGRADAGVADFGAAEVPEAKQPEAPAAALGAAAAEPDAPSGLAQEMLDSNAAPASVPPTANRESPADPLANELGEDDAERNDSAKKPFDAASQPAPAESPVSPPVMPSDDRKLGDDQLRGAATQSQEAEGRPAGAVPAPAAVDTVVEQALDGASRRRLNEKQPFSSANQRAFAQRLQWEPRKSEVAAPATAPESTSAGGRVAPPPPADFGGGYRGGLDGGSVPGDGETQQVPARPTAPSEAVAGDEDGEAIGRELQAGTPSAAQSPSSRGLVRVLFVLRAVEPAVNVAADIAADEASAKAARVMAAEPAAESAADAVIEAEASPVRE